MGERSRWRLDADRIRLRQSELLDHQGAQNDANALCSLKPTKPTTVPAQSHPRTALSKRPCRQGHPSLASERWRTLIVNSLPRSDKHAVTTGARVSAPGLMPRRVVYSSGRPNTLPSCRMAWRFA